MSVRIIAEIGSTHAANLDLAKRAVDYCVEMRIDAIKFQLFSKDSVFAKNNVWLPPDLYIEIADYAKEQYLDCSASAFDDASLEFLLLTEPSFVKFAYSQKDKTHWIKEVLSRGIEAIVSCDVMSDKDVPDGATKLLCIPQYPVYFQIAFDELFPRFDGFSDHTLGWEQTLNATSAGAKIIEKHMRTSVKPDNCADSQFALSPAEFSAMVASIRSQEKKRR